MASSRDARLGLTESKARSKAVWKNGTAYLFISPFYILFALFGIFPLVFSFYLSFARWNGTGKITEVGLANYAVLIRDPSMQRALFNTFYIGIGYVPALTFAALGLAVLLNLPWLRARRVFRTIYLLPVVTSPVVIGLVFSALLSTKYGLVNGLLQGIGLAPVPWLVSTTWSKSSVILLIIWRYLGTNMIIMSAGLQSIPEEVYEAAKVDGARGDQSFWRITMPMMKPTILIVLILSIIGTMQLFAEPYLLTRGGPAESSLTTGLYLYSQAFEYWKFGYASAVGYVAAAIMIIISMIVFRLLGKRPED